MNTKERLSASVDSVLIREAEKAVKRGFASSVSAWENEALELKLPQERKLESLAAFVSAYEKEHGEISPEEIRLATRRVRSKAVTVRGLPEAQSPAAPRRRSGR